MRCNICGFSNPSGNKFCQNCGSKIASDLRKSYTAERPVRRENTERQAMRMAPYDRPDPNRARSNNKRGNIEPAETEQLPRSRYYRDRALRRNNRAARRKKEMLNVLNAVLAVMLTATLINSIYIMVKSRALSSDVPEQRVETVSE